MTAQGVLLESGSGKAGRNERRKLFATTINASGLAIFAVGALTPLLQQAWTTGLIARALVFTAAGVILHVVASRHLRRLED